MKMISRRNLVSLAVAAPVLTAAALPRRAAAADIRPDLSRVRTRTVNKYDVLYKTAHGKPNDLSPGPNPGEMWVLDQGLSQWATLSRIADGSTIREFKTEAVGPSGMVVDDDGVMWITGTHASMIVAVNSTTGQTIAKYYTPGAGRIYNKVGDPPGV
jgi:sugar lactone lactonase YvrE